MQKCCILTIFVRREWLFQVTVCSHYTDAWKCFRNVDHLRPALIRSNLELLKVLLGFQVEQRRLNLQLRRYLRSCISLLIPGACRWMCKMMNAPAAERNKDPILSVLKSRVKSDRHGNALEISSGTGQHVVHFANALPNITWQPSEFDGHSLSR